MRKVMFPALAALLACALFMMAGCSGDSSSSSSASQPASSSTGSSEVSTSQPVSSSGTGASQAPGSTDDSAPASQVESGPLDMQQLLEDLSQAAALGTTIQVRELDLSLAGVDVENFAEFAGAEAQTSSQNGGIVVIVYAKPGTAQTVADQMAAFRDSRMGNEDYADFEDARANTEQARIVVNGDYVVYAVSATGQDGGYDTLDAAISAAFA